MKKVHLGINCHPYSYEWFVYCKQDTIPIDELGSMLVTEDEDEMTCLKCKKVLAKVDAEIATHLNKSKPS